MPRFGDQIVVGRYSVTVDENERGLTHSVEMSMPSFVTMILFIIFAPRLFLVSLLSVAAMTNKNVVDNAQSAFKSVVKSVLKAKNKILQNTDSLKDSIAVEKSRFDDLDDEVQPEVQSASLSENDTMPIIEELGTELQPIDSLNTVNGDGDSNGDLHGGAYGSL